MEKLYDIRIDWQYGVADFSVLKTMAISKRQYLPILIFGLLPKLSDDLQKQVLLFLVNCVSVPLVSPCDVGPNPQRGNFLRDRHPP